MAESLIVCNKDIVGGQPTLKGTRLTVFNIVFGVFTDGKDYLTDHELKGDDVFAAIKYCISLECENNPHKRFCENCIMEDIQANEKNSDFRVPEKKIVGWAYAKGILNRKA